MVASNPVTTFPEARFRIEFPADLAAALDATRQAREFLLSQNLSCEEADGWRLALAEATNNVVLHGSVPRTGKPVRLEIWCRAEEVQAHLLDSGPGFDWPTHIELPEPSDEHHRGVYLIAALTDRAEYQRGPGENRLVLAKRRQPASSTRQGA